MVWLHLSSESFKQPVEFTDFIQWPAFGTGLNAAYSVPTTPPA